MVSIAKFAFCTCHFFCLFNCHFILLVSLGVTVLKFPCFPMGRLFCTPAVPLLKIMDHSLEPFTLLQNWWDLEDQVHVKAFFWVSEPFCSIWASANLAILQLASTILLEYPLHSTAGYLICFHALARSCKTFSGCFGITKFDLWLFLYLPSIWWQYLVRILIRFFQECHCYMTVGYPKGLTTLSLSGVACNQTGMSGINNWWVVLILVWHWFKLKYNNGPNKYFEILY